jgi:signal peptide peptidase-like protein 2B
VISLGVAITWYLLKDTSWSFILQDFMGVSLCLFFLTIVRIPNLQVATILLSLAFFYDIFFVFITPFIFGSSVMVHAAVGPDKPQHLNDENFCEKYPKNSDCSSSTMPNLLLVPWIGDYRGGSSMLGLGDIMIPGLFLVLVARIDVRQRGILIYENICDGLFGISIVGYGLGLILADMAVEYFQTGQPALLYIVPCILPPVLLKCKLSGNLFMLWEKLPPPRTVAIPLRFEEQQALLANSEVISASAQWSSTTGDLDIVVVDRGKVQTKSSQKLSKLSDKKGDSQAPYI